MTLANYAPEMFELWKVACEENIELEFATKAKAIRFRFRMYQLRKDMRKEKHFLLPFAEKCMIRLYENTCIICPVDDDFGEILRKQGITIDEDISGEIPDNPEPPTEETEMHEAVLHWRNRSNPDN